MGGSLPPLVGDEVAVTPGGYELSLTVHQWINDGLMAVFFLLVGLEIKREVLAGELASPRQAALPIAAAIGGMVVPALIYALTHGGGLESRGWAIPMATDIAFALGVLALVAPRAPTGLKIFLAALAIVDDMGAVLVIAIFYTSAIAWGALGSAALILLLLIALNAWGLRSLTPYLVLASDSGSSCTNRAFMPRSPASCSPSRFRHGRASMRRNSRPRLDACWTTSSDRDRRSSRVDQQGTAGRYR